MKTFEVDINVMDSITVDAENAEDAKQAVRDIFSIHTADNVELEAREIGGE